MPSFSGLGLGLRSQQNSHLLFAHAHANFRFGAYMVFRTKRWTGSGFFPLALAHFAIPATLKFARMCQRRPVLVGK